MALPEPAYEKFFREQKIAGHEYLPAKTKEAFHEAHGRGIISVEDLRRLGEKIRSIAAPYENAGHEHFIRSDIEKLCEANHPKSTRPDAVRRSFDAVDSLVEKVPEHADYSKEEFRRIIDSVTPDDRKFQFTAHGFPTAVLFFEPTSAPKAEFLLTVDELWKALNITKVEEKTAAGLTTKIVLVPRGSQGHDWITHLAARQRASTAKMFLKKP